MTKLAKKGVKTLHASTFAVKIDHPEGKAGRTEVQIRGDKSLLPLSQSVMIELESNATKRPLAYYLWKVFLNTYKLRINRIKTERRLKREQKDVIEKAKVTEERQKEVREKIKNQV